MHAYTFLAARNVLAPAGWFYAHQASIRLALDDAHTLRIRLAPYNTEQDVARLLTGLSEFVAA